MGELVTQAGKKVAAVGVLALVAFLIFKAVVGFVVGILWLAVAVVAVGAVIWALRVL